jgi:hypothetical protein
MGGLLCVRHRRVLGTRSVRCGHGMPARAVPAVQLVARRGWLLRTQRTSAQDSGGQCDRADSEEGLMQRVMSKCGSIG